MRFAVLGMGKTGHAMAVYLKSKGQEVVVWNRNPQKIDDIANCGINASGAIEGRFEVETEKDLGIAIHGADYIVVMTVANGHKDIANLLKGRLENGQRIIVFNGNWGAYEFYCVLKDELLTKDVILTETSGMLIMSSFTGTAACRLSKIKNEIVLSAVKAGDEGVVIEELKEVYPQFVPAKSIIDTSFNNSNPILHCPISFFNLTRIENAEDYGFYTDASSHVAVDFTEEIDKERVALAKKMGISSMSCLDILNSFWDDQHDNLYDALQQNPDYQRIKGPKSLDYRFLTEDLPYGLVPIQRLAKQYGVDTPYLDAMIQMYRLILGNAIVESGPDFSKVSLKEFF